MANSAILDLTKDMSSGLTFVGTMSLDVPPGRVGDVRIDTDTNKIYTYTTSNTWMNISPSDPIMDTTAHYPRIEPKRFNCKRCGAVGQIDICEYCGSAPE